MTMNHQILLILNFIKFKTKEEIESSPTLSEDLDIIELMADISRVNRIEPEKKLKQLTCQ